MAPGSLNSEATRSPWGPSNAALRCASLSISAYKSIFIIGMNLDRSFHHCACRMASVSNDSLMLWAAYGQPDNSSMFFQAANNLDGAGVFLGDGIRCAAGNLNRLKVQVNDSTGYASTSGTVISVRSAQLGYTIQVGDKLRYQWWFRDTNNPPCGLGVNDSNTSNGYEIVWLP